MSKLDLHSRPVVLFDPANKMHRGYVNNFMLTGSWRDCPIRFAVEEDHGMLIGSIQRKLILWYAEQEKKGRLKVAKMPRGKKSLGLTGTGFELTLD